MIFPELLYQLSPRDQQVTWLDPVIRRVTTTQAALTVNALDEVVPTGRAFLLTNATLFADPGAGQNIDDIGLNIAVLNPGAGVAVRIATRSGAAGADLLAILNWTGQILIPAGWQLQGSAHFNALGAANEIRFDLMGILIPIGNIQRV